LVGEPRVVGDVAQVRDPRRNGRERVAWATELDLGHDESLEGPAKYVNLPAIDHVPNLLDLPVTRHLEELLTALFVDHDLVLVTHEDRKSTRLNSSHVKISYAVFCLKKKTAYTAS